MPTNDNNSILGQEWLKNATYMLGIPLYQSGELDIFDYMTEPVDNLNESRDRVMGLQSQTVAVLFATFIFVRNFNISVRMVISRYRTISAWCCFLPSALGIIFGLMIIYAWLFSGLNCRRILWFSGFINTIAIMCNSIILLQKAYLVLCRQRWIAVFGIIFTLPQLGFLIIVIIACPVALEPKNGCVLYYPTYLPWYWFFAAVPINLFFSAIFSHVTYKQYCIFGSKPGCTWRVTVFRRCVLPYYVTLFVALLCIPDWWKLCNFVFCHRLVTRLDYFN
ncbi:hypothetical protein BDF19DRAFT_321043 [Syncephalis fuscata]|nr:hypothetical protein BDF19DRAFT_321043 [Syncephalis fuscata]